MVIISSLMNYATYIANYYCAIGSVLFTVLFFLFNVYHFNRMIYTQTPQKQNTFICMTIISRL